MTEKETNEIPLDPPHRVPNDGSSNNRYTLTEADMQRIIGFVQRIGAESLDIINWLDSIEPDYVEIDPDGDLSEVDL